MRFYEVTYTDETAGDGFASEYFATREEAEARKAEFEAEDAEPNRCDYCDYVGPLGLCPNCATLTVREAKRGAEIRTLIWRGRLTKAAMLWALRVGG